jgi:hypothetical protein
MKIALCFSGHLRDLDETKNFWTELIEKYKIDVYASFWDEESVELGDTMNNFLKIYTPKKVEVENYDVFKESTLELTKLNIKVPHIIPEVFHDNIKSFTQLSMHYKIWRANMLTKTLDIKYDLIIRARIDTVLDETFEIISNDYLNIPMGEIRSALDNSWGINDCFAYGTPKIMDYYSTCFLNMMSYLNDGHYLWPFEHFLSVHMSKVKVQIRFFPNYMIITRKSKNIPYEIYNRFMTVPQENIVWSDNRIFLPQPDFSFKKKIKDDFNV